LHCFTKAPLPPHPSHNIGAAPIAGGLADNILTVGADSLLSGLSPDLALRSLCESRDQQDEMPFGIAAAAATTGAGIAP
jgi:hypothetical protein